MKIKLWLKYLIYFILIFFVILLRESKLTKFFNQDFRINYYNVVISMLLGVCIGLLLGLEHFLKEIGKEGRWKIFLPKLIMVGLPSFYISLTNIFIYSGIPFFQNVFAYPSIHYINYSSAGCTTLMQPVFGYILITCFYKWNKSI